MKRSDAAPVTEVHGSSPIRLPGQTLEASSFSLVGNLETVIADAAARRGEALANVPLWSTQVALFALQSATTGASTGVRGFMEFARRCADYGSRVFPDSTLWPADESGLKAALEVLPTDLGHLLMVVGRTLDYGRTLEWSLDRRGVSLSRNLVAAKSQGIFYTPAFVAQHLARRCIEAARTDECPRVCDPAVGGGSFLLAAAAALLEWWEPAVVRRSLFGTDTDPVAVEISAVLIDAICGMWRAGEVPPFLNVNYLVGDAFGGPVMSEGPALVGALNWRTSFPTVFDGPRPGFDVVLVNPPFGRHKIDSDWMIAKEMRLDKVLLQDLRKSGRQRAIDLRSSGYFPLSTVGVLDKSRIGLERSMQLTSDGGSLGAVVPSTIAADAHSYLLRQSLLEEWDVKEINEFPETARLFFDVSQSVSVLHAVKGSSTATIRVRSGLRAESDLLGGFSAEWPVDVIRRVSPKLAIPLRISDPLGILERVHRYPSLQDFTGIANARGEVDVSAFEAALTDNEAMIPLVRGDQIDCFRSNLPSEKKSFVDADIYADRVAASPKYDHFLRDRVVGRQCSYLYRHKRLSFALVPARSAVANSCNYLSTDDAPDNLLYLLGLLNSSLLNWRFKITNSNNHVANAELADLPIPHPSRRPDALVSSICDLALALSDHPSEDDQQLLDELVFNLYGLTSKQARFVAAAEAAR